VIFLKKTFNSVFLLVFAILAFSNNCVYALKMDVKCTQYVHSDDDNGNDVDVRVFVLGLKPNADYIVKVVPNHNPSTSVLSRADYEGIFWVTVKIPNGENSSSFEVRMYEGKDVHGNTIVSEDEYAPCYRIRSAHDVLKIK
jgi:hypothetical protein